MIEQKRAGIGGTHWLVWPCKFSREYVLQRYREITGREPDRIHSPEESGTEFWWTGFVRRDEYGKYIQEVQKEGP